MYKNTCSVDQSISYIGKTSHQVFKRVADHKRKDKRSATFDHFHHCLHYQNSKIDNNFKVVKRCARCEFFSLKSMLIKREKQKLNTQVSANGKIALLTIY